MCWAEYLEAKLLKKPERMLYRTQAREKQQHLNNSTKRAYTGDAKNEDVGPYETCTDVTFSSDGMPKYHMTPAEADAHQ